MFASILQSKITKTTGWAAYWEKHPHEVKDAANRANLANNSSLQAIHEGYAKQAAKEVGHPPISNDDISHSATKTTVKTPHAYKLGQGVIDHLSKQGYERKDMVRSGTDSIYTMEHPETKERVKVGYFHSFGKTLSGKGMPSRVEISHVPA